MAYAKDREGNITAAVPHLGAKANKPPQCAYCSLPAHREESGDFLVCDHKGCLAPLCKKHAFHGKDGNGDYCRTHKPLTYAIKRT
jgi:hypothetical protein